MGRELPDEEIIRLVRDGEADRFGLLVDRYTRSVYAMGMSFFHNEDDACDFVQDVFVKAYSSLESYEGRAKFLTWLLRIGYNTGVNAIQRGKRQEALPEDYEPLDPVTPEDLIILKESRAEILAAVAELPPAYGACVELSFFQGLSYVDIEEITGIPVNTVKSNVFRAKERLRNRLSKLV